VIEELSCVMLDNDDRWINDDRWSNDDRWRSNDDHGEHPSSRLLLCLAALLHQLEALLSYVDLPLTSSQPRPVSPVVQSQAVLFKAVLGIRDILVRIRIPGSVRYL
jgi:hypothetical protein